MDNSSMKHQRLRESLILELQSLQRVLVVAERLQQSRERGESDERNLYAAASVILNIYNGIENIFKQITKYYGIPLPVSPEWHITLMNWYAAGETRPFLHLPILIPPKEHETVTNLRKFRHVVMHGYSFTLDPERVFKAIAMLPSLYHAFQSEVEIFLATLPEE